MVCVSGCWEGSEDCSLSRTLHRFIKRKKFDDELVESSLAKSSTRAKGASGVEPGRCSGSEPSSSEKKKVRDWEMGWGGVGERWVAGPQPVSWQEFFRGCYERTELPQPNLRSLPPGSLSLPTPSFLLHSPSFSASCITFCVGGMERASILGTDSLFPALLV